MTVSCRSLPRIRTESGSRHAGWSSGQHAGGPKIFRTLIHLGLLGNVKPTPGKRSSSAYLELACCIRCNYRSPGSTTWPGPFHDGSEPRNESRGSQFETLRVIIAQPNVLERGIFSTKMKFVLCLSSASWPAWLGDFLTFPAWGDGTPLTRTRCSRRGVTVFIRLQPWNAGPQQPVCLLSG